MKRDFKKTFLFLITTSIFYNSSAYENGDTLSKMSLEELMNVKVVTASKKSERIDEAPNVMYVIDEEEIRNKGFRTLRDVLVTIPGFGVFHRDLQFVGQVRGIAPNENEKMTFMINGHTINQVTEPEILNGPINLDNVKRIEIIVGPGSVLYGPETLTSIVNIITKKTDKNELSLSAGSYNNYSGTSSFGKKWDDKRYVFASITGMSMNGWNAFDSLDHGNNNVGKLHPSFFLFSEASYDDWNIQFSSNNITIPELAIIKNTGNEGKRYDYHDKFAITNKQKLNNSLSLVSDVSYANKRMLRVQTTSEENKSSESYDLHQKVYKVNTSLIAKTKKNYFQTGLQLFYYQNRHNYTFQWYPNYPADTLGNIHSLVRNRGHYNIGFFCSDEYKFSKKIKVTGAFRLDYNTLLKDDKPYFSPRISFIYKPYRLWTTKLMYNQAVHMPSPWMSPLNPYWDDTNPLISEGLSDYLVNPLAEKPEILTAYEWQNIVYIRDTRVSINVYYQKLKDFIIWYRPFTNVGDFEGLGTEIDVQSFINRYLTIWGNASYTDANFNLTANKIDYTAAIHESGKMHAVPKLTANAGLSISAGSFSFNPMCRYFTEQRAKRSPDSDAISINNRYYMDATLRWHHKKFDISLIGKNILNNTKEVSAQAYLYTYYPRGITGELVMRYSF